MTLNIINNSNPPYTFNNINNIDNEKYLFHSFSTSNFLEWLPLHSNSINLSYGNGTKQIIQTLNLTEKQKNVLYCDNKNVEIYNLELDELSISEQINIPLSKIQKFKDELKNGFTTNENYKLKLFISVKLRYLSLKGIFNELQKLSSFSFLIHSDIDINHRTNLIDKIKEYDFDIGLFGRNFLLDQSLPLGAYIVFKNTQNAYNFICDWMKTINNIPFDDWPRGYGQISLCQVLKNSIKRNTIKLLDFSKIENLRMSKLSDDSADIWLNSNSDHSGSSLETPFFDTINDLGKRIYFKSKDLVE